MVAIYKDLRNEDLLIDPYGHYDFIRIWPSKEAPPTLLKYAASNEEDDALIWVPNKFLGTPNDKGSYYINHPIGELWDGENAKYLRFRDGLLIVWISD